jgi:hypothetical protein
MFLPQSIVEFRVVAFGNQLVNFSAECGYFEQLLPASSGSMIQPIPLYQSDA